MSVPFHKQTDPLKMAGQVVFKRSCDDFGRCNCTEDCVERQFKDKQKNKEQYLHQYITRKQEEPPHITFEEWWNTVGADLHGNYYREVYEEVWNTALTKGKL